MKAALFETEAQLKSGENLNQPIEDSIPEDGGECRPYIPQPDYDNDHYQQHFAPSQRNGGYQEDRFPNGRVYPQQELSVETNSGRNQPYRINAVHRSPRSPSQRIIHRLELQRQQEGWISSGIGDLVQGSPGSSHGHRYVHDSRLPVYNGTSGYNGESGIPYNRYNSRDDGVTGGYKGYTRTHMITQNGYDPELKLNGHDANMNMYRSHPAAVGGIENSYRR